MFITPLPFTFRFRLRMKTVLKFSAFAQTSKDKGTETALRRNTCKQVLWIRTEMYSLTHIMYELYYKERDKTLLLCSQKGRETGNTEAKQVLVPPFQTGAEAHIEPERKINLLLNPKNPGFGYCSSCLAYFIFICQKFSA